MNSDQTHNLALNAADPAGETTAETIALCAELPGGDTPPEWIELLPAGELVTGVDGRAWVNDRPEAVVSAFNRPIPIDWEHATEHKARKGEPAPAAGWIEALELRGGAVWGRAAWTERGAASVNSREYRFISPAFIFERKSGRIARLVHAGLTNTPNLNLAALNKAENPNLEQIMFEKLLAALGLNKDATEEQALNAVEKLKGEKDTALNQAKAAEGQMPSLDKFVPRADYDVAMNRATAAEKALAETKAAELEKEIETAVNSAIEGGKIAPASKDFYLDTCRAAGGLDRFREFIKVAPDVAGDSGLEGKKPDENTGTAMNSEEQQIAAMFGNSADDIQKYGRA